MDPGLAAAAVACGLAPDTTATTADTVGVRFFYPPHNDARIESVDFDATDLPAEIDLAVPLVAPGDVVSPPRKGLIDGRVAFATAVASSAGACRAALDQAGAKLRLRVAGRG